MKSQAKSKSWTDPEALETMTAYSLFCFEARELGFPTASWSLDGQPYRTSPPRLF